MDDLPLYATTAIVAATSVALVATVSLLRVKALLWLAAVVIPVAVSYWVYWAPVWSGENSSEYSAWAPVLIGIWSLASVVASLIFVAVVSKLRNSTHV